MKLSENYTRNEWSLLGNKTVAYFDFAQLITACYMMDKIAQFDQSWLKKLHSKKVKTKTTLETSEYLHQKRVNTKTTPETSESTPETSEY